MRNTQDGLKTTDVGDSDGEGQADDLNSHLNMVELKWKKFLNLEIEIERKLAPVVETSWLPADETQSSAVKVEVASEGVIGSGPDVSYSGNVLNALGEFECFV